MKLCIDEIFEMISVLNDKETQFRGIEEGKKVKHLSIFFQPIDVGGIYLWENCAKIITSKSDDELEQYIIPMFEWLKDMNWPGAEIIYERLKSMPFEFVKIDYDICLQMSEQSRDEVWNRVLLNFVKEAQGNS